MAAAISTNGFMAATAFSAPWAAAATVAPTEKSCRPDATVDMAEPILNTASPVPMATSAVATAPECWEHQSLIFVTLSTMPLAQSATVLKALPAVSPHEEASKPVSSPNFDRASLQAVHTLSMKPLTLCTRSPNDLSAPVLAKAPTNCPTACTPCPTQLITSDTREDMSLRTPATFLVSESMVPDGIIVVQSMDWIRPTASFQASCSPPNTFSCCRSVPSFPNQSLTVLTAEAAASPTLPNWLEKSLIAEPMLSTPTASMTFWMAF